MERGVERGAREGMDQCLCGRLALRSWRFCKRWRIVRRGGRCELRVRYTRTMALGCSPCLSAAVIAVALIRASGVAHHGGIDGTGEIYVCIIYPGGQVQGLCASGIGRASSLLFPVSNYLALLLEYLLDYLVTRVLLRVWCPPNIEDRNPVCCEESSCLIMTI